MSLSINDSLTNLTAGLSPARSKAQMATYSTAYRSDAELNAAYDGSDLVQRVVDMPAEDMTRNWREWQASAEDITKIEEVERRFGISNKVEKTIRRARKLGDAYIYFDNGEDPSTPLVVETAAPLRFVNALRPYMITPNEIENDPASEFYDLPRMYDIASTTSTTVHVHPTRIVHLVGKDNDNYTATGKNISIISAMFDSLINFDGVMANVADMTWEAKIDVFSVIGLMNKVQDPDQLAAVMTKYQLMATQKGVNGMMIIDKDEEEYTQKQLTFAALPDIIDRFQIAASGAAQIPRSKLFGVQTGGLGNSGESDEVNYNNRIKSNQENDITPAMWRLDELIIKTALNTRPPEVHYNWRSLTEMDAGQKSDIGLKIAQRNKALVDSGIFAAEFLTEPTVNEFTELGIATGLEQAYKEWVGDASGSDGDLPE